MDENTQLILNCICLYNRKHGQDPKKIILSDSFYRTLALRDAAILIGNIVLDAPSTIFGIPFEVDHKQENALRFE
jgi:hypothetical protein